MPAALLVFLIGIAYLPGTMSASMVGRWAAAAFGTAALLWTIRISPNRGHWLFGAFLAWCVIGLWWTATPLDSINAIVQLVMLFIAFCVGSWLLDLRPCYIAIGCASAVSALFMLLQYFGHEPVLTATSGSPVGLFLNRDTAAEFGAVALVLVTLSRLWAFVPGAAVCALLPGSRAVLVALAVTFALWLWHRCHQRIAAAAILVSLVIIAAVLVISPIRLDVLDERLLIWITTAINLSWFGWGLGSFATLLPAFEYAHNEPLQLIFETGVGAGLLAGVAFCALWRTDGPAWYALVTILVMGLAGFPLHAPATAMVAALLAGHLCGTRDRILVRQYLFGNHGRNRDESGEPLWAGALSVADISRLDIPVRPEPAERAGKLPAAL